MKITGIKLYLIGTGDTGARGAAVGESQYWGGGWQAQTLVANPMSDERPCSSIEDTVVINHVHQSIYHALGIDLETNYVVEGRPFYTTPDGLGKPILDLFGDEFKKNPKKVS